MSVQNERNPNQLHSELWRTVHARGWSNVVVCVNENGLTMDIIIDTKGNADLLNKQQLLGSDDDEDDDDVNPENTGN